MSHETAAPERKHIRTLERRIAHLEARIEERQTRDGVLQGSASFEASELAALRVAHQVMRLYRDTSSEDDDPTHELLERAAQQLTQWMDAYDIDDNRILVEQLRDRARLLHELEQ